jgi:nucleotide-binding universal stress UspA family protein
MSDAAETYLVVIDDTPECARALRYAARRARRTGARLRLLHVLKPAQFLQWGGVQADMEAEAAEYGQSLLEAHAAEAEAITGVRPAMSVIRGKPGEAVLASIEQDRSIRALVLAAAARGRPGPLVDFFSGERAGSLPCIVMIVPGGITPDEIDRLG